MPNIAALLKSELSRLARKEVRHDIAALKKAIATYRSEIAALKRRSHALEQEVRRLRGKPSAAAGPAPADDEAPAQSLRFSAKGLASQRKRLGLSAEDCGQLLGASGQSVYNWEAGKARPRPKHLAAIAALKSLGKRRAAALIDAARSAG